MTDLYVGLARQVELGYYGINLVRFALAFLVLVLPATLMGGTLPVMVKFFTRNRESLGRRVGHLYALNTLGAVVGTLSAGFFLILVLGVREAAYLAGVVNLIIASVVFWMDRKIGVFGEPVASAGSDGGRGAMPPGPEVPEGQSSGAAGSSAAREGQAVNDRAVRLAFWAIGVSGFCALAFEVFWTRSLVFFLDNSTHAFTTILTAFLLGIGIGSLVVAAFIDTRKKLLGWLGWIQVLIGISAILAIPVLNHTTPVFERMAGVSLDSLLPWRWMAARFVNALSVMLIPTLLMGMAFPVAAKIYTRHLGAIGTSLGNIYAINTLGGVLGSALAGFALIPLVGVQNGIILVATVNTAAGVVLLLGEPALARNTRIGSAIVAGLIFLVGSGALVTSGGLVLSSYYEEEEMDEVISYEEGIGATVKVFRDTYGERVISINGFPVAGEPLGYQDPQIALAHFPLLLNRVPSPRVAIIGFGAGGTSWGVLQHDVESVDCVELVPAVPRAAHLFPTVNHGVLDEPKYNLILNDGRNYMLVTDREYDVISIDATSPKMAGNGSLYSLDFYQLLKERISEDGIVVQWIPHHLLSDREVKMTAKSFMTAFPHATLWFSPLRQNAVLIGTQKELEVDYGRVEAAYRKEVIREQLASVNMADAIGFLSGFLMGEETLAGYVGAIRDNTDNHPVLEFTPALAYFLADAYRLRNVFDFRDAREIVLPWLVNLGETEEEVVAVTEAIQRRYEAVSYSINGDIALVLGERERAMSEYRQALSIDPMEKNWLTARLEREGPR